MTRFTLQPVMMTGQASRSETTHARAGGVDPVAAAIHSSLQEEPGEDEAHLSAAASLLAVAIDGPANVRWEKIESLRADIAAGTYRISSIEIASRVIEALAR